MKKVKIISIVFVFLFFLSEYVFSDFIGVGRGEGLNGILAIFDGEKEIKKILIGEKVSLFCIDVTGDGTLVIGGAKNNAGSIWMIKDGKTVFFQQLPQARVIYSVKVASNGEIWSAGSHIYMGACVWHGDKKNGFKISSVLSKGSVAYAITEGVDGKIFAGGIFYTHGKVWIYNGKRWDLGTVLQDSRMVNTLCVDNKGNIIAAGQKIRHGQSASGHGTVHQGGIWIFNGKQWSSVIEIPQSINIYCSVKDKDGTIWLGGAGENNKTLWYSDALLWKPVELENSLALYSIAVDKESGNILVSGWNKKIRARSWLKKYGKDWSKGLDVEKCNVIRGLISIQGEFKK